MVTIELIDFSDWAVGDYIEQVVLVIPDRDEGLAVQFVHFPQSSELLVLNLGYDTSQADLAIEPLAHYHFLCGKNDRNAIYKTRLDEPVCIIQFKPYAWYAFAKNSVEKYNNRIVKFSCDMEACLQTFMATKFPDYLGRYLKPSKIRERAYRNMPSILKYIDEHINTVTVAGLSKAFKLSEATLRRYFKKYVGMNVSAYIRSQKVRLMTIRMYQNDYNAVSVQECGFYDQSHFIREFKRIHAATPTRFLQELRRVFQESQYAEQLFRACYLTL